MARTLARSWEAVRVQLTDDWWVEIQAELSWGERQALRKMMLANPESAWPFISTVLKRWNLEDGHGNIVPIVEESLPHMREEDLVLLANALKRQYAGMFEEQKKA